MTREAERIREEFTRRRREMPADYYARWRPENLFLRHGQERALLSGLRDAGAVPLAGRKVLEVGCGDADWLSIFVEIGSAPSDLSGIDLDEERVAEARTRLPVGDFRVGDASFLPWPDETFDIVAQSTVFSSILDSDMRERVATEMVRVLKRSGIVVWYDFFVDNPSNSHVRGVSGREIRRLFPGLQCSLRRATLAPPLARRLAVRSWGLAAFLEHLKLFDTHFLAVLRKEPF